MTWNIYPAIDLRGGKAVRLFQGDYAQETVYGDPVEMALRWQEQGAKWLHLVDLDGAKVGEPVQLEIISKIVKEIAIPVQVGGGIRSLSTIENYLNAGVRRIILGTAAIENKDLVMEALRLNKKAVAIGIDARDGYVATRGWLDTSKIEAIELGKRLVELGVETFIFTDIAKDGTLTGPNVNATLQFAKETGGNVIASGGVSQLKDLIELKKLEQDGVIGAIIGKALYTGAFELDDALKLK